MKVQPQTYSQRILAGGRLVVRQREARFRAAVDAIRSRCGPVEDLLDIGAADGIAMPFLKPIARRVVSLNYYPSHTEQFRRNYPDEEVVTADARSLPFDDSSFELCTAFEAINCVPGRSDRMKCYREIHRVLKPGGWFVATLPIEVGPTAIIKWVARAATGYQTPGMTFPIAMRHAAHRFCDIERYDQGCHTGFCVHSAIRDIESVFGMVEAKPIRSPVLVAFNMVIAAQRAPASADDGVTRSG